MEVDKRVKNFMGSKLLSILNKKSKNANVNVLKTMVTKDLENDSKNLNSCTKDFKNINKNRKKDNNSLLSQITKEFENVGNEFKITNNVDDQ